MLGSHIPCSDAGVPGGPASWAQLHMVVHLCMKVSMLSPVAWHSPKQLTSALSLLLHQVALYAKPEWCVQACNRQGFVSAPLYHEFGAGMVHRMLHQLQATVLFAGAPKLEALLGVKARGCLRLATVVCIGDLPGSALAKVCCAVECCVQLISTISSCCQDSSSPSTC